MTSSHETGRFGEARKGKIGVLIEDLRLGHARA